MTKIIDAGLNNEQRGNLAKLAGYLEALPADYSHFDMAFYYGHRGGCDLASALDPSVVAAIDYIDDCFNDADDMMEATLYATSLSVFLGNCGTTACAIGHGPAAGIELEPVEIETRDVDGVKIVTGIDFNRYAERFVPGTAGGRYWNFLFGDSWEPVDNHHYGAAARIRFMLDKGGIPEDPDHRGCSMDEEDAVELYRPYRVDAREAQPA
jgi:hypothetical protein